MYQNTKTHKSPHSVFVEVAVISDLEMIFKEFDSDGNGSLNVKELGNTVRALGWNPTEEQIREIIKEVDDEGTVTLELTLGLSHHFKMHNDTDILSTYI